MNKIIIDKPEITLKGEYQALINNSSNITIENQAYLSTLNLTNNVTYNISNNSSFTWESVSVLDHDIDCTVNINSDALVNISWLIISKNEDINVHIAVNMEGNNSNCKVAIRVVNLSDIDLIFDGVVAKGTINNELIEDARGLITTDKLIKISPNMLIDTNDVLANHLSTIGSYDKYDLFYLESLGISEDLAKTMCRLGFMKEIFTNDFKDNIDWEVIM